MWQLQVWHWWSLRRDPCRSTSLIDGRPCSSLYLFQPIMVRIYLSVFLTFALLFFLPPETLNELEFFYLPDIDPADFRLSLSATPWQKSITLFRSFESVEKDSWAYWHPQHCIMFLYRYEWPGISVATHAQRIHSSALLTCRAASSSFLFLDVPFISSHSIFFAQFNQVILRCKNDLLLDIPESPE